MWPPVPGRSIGAPLDPTLTAAEVAFGAFELVALALGLVWTAINVYHFVPIAWAAVESVAGRDRVPSVPDDESLPTIDVVLPAYQEGAVVEQSIRSVREADYPQARLSLLVAVEAGDADTRAALADLDDLAFTEVAVPARYPGEPSKPRALNYAFERTSAEIVGVVDAEDLVDPGLFRQAVHRLETDCQFVQARLDMVNEGDGWLNTLFRAEYGFWYEVVLPAFTAAGYPVPLAGTSCLFRRSLLVASDVERRERFGEGLERDDRLWTGAYRLFGRTPWDPDNVTEDFELGLFLWEGGFDVGYLESTTAEESPLALDAWMRQRTRWNKGKLQTLFKYLRSPPRGASATVHLHLQSMLPHVGPLNLAGLLVLLAVANLARYEPSPIVGGVLGLGLAFALLTAGLYAYGFWRASDTAPPVRLRRSVLVALTLPLYWLLQWLADARAVGQFYRGWLAWERVEHLGRNAVAATAPAIVRTDGDTLAPWRRYAALAAVVLVGAALRFHALAAESLWSDEIYSIAVRGPMALPDVLVAPPDPHPPLYFVLLDGWLATFGSTPWVARSLSAVLSTATIAAVYALGKELLDDRVGLTAAAFVAVSSFQVHVGQTVRMYALFGLLTVTSWLCFVRLGRSSRWAPVGYVATSAAMLYTHAFAVFVLLAQHAYVLLSETRGGVPVRRWIRAQVALALVGIPMLGFLAWRAFGPLVDPSSRAAISWIPIPSTVALAGTVLEYVGYPAHYPIDGGTTLLWVGAGVLGMGFVVTALLAIVTYRPDDGFVLGASWRTGQLAALLAVPLGVPFLLSYVVAPMYAPRFTLPASYGFALLAAAGIHSVPGKWPRRVVLAVLLVGSGALLGTYYAAESVEDWEAATATVETRAAPGDLLVVQPGWIEGNVDYYYDGPAMERVTLPSGALSARDRTDLGDRLAAHDRAWVVAAHGDPSPALRSLLDGRRRTVVYEAGVITVLRYDADRTAGSRVLGVERPEQPAAERLDGVEPVGV